MYLLGVDCGGTKSTAVVTDGKRELGRGEGGAANLAILTREEFARSLRSAIGAAISSAGLGVDHGFDAACVAMAGFSAATRRSAAESALKSAAIAGRYLAVPDYAAALRGAAPGGAGIAAIAGTGAVVYGRRSDGVDARVDGLGYLLGDRGSGADIGVRGMRYAAEALQRSDQVTELASAILDELQATSLEELIERVYSNPSPRRYAEIGGVVLKLADQDEPDALRLVQEAAAALRESTNRCATRLGGFALPVFLLGGVGLGSWAYRAAFAAGSSPIELAQPEQTPAFGAALLAADAR